MQIWYVTSIRTYTHFRLNPVLYTNYDLTMLITIRPTSSRFDAYRSTHTHFVHPLN